MEQRHLYWIWLQQGLGFASRKASFILQKFGTAEKFYQAGVQEWRLLGCFRSSEIKRLEQASLEEAKKTARRAELLGCRMVTPEDEEYPERLRALEDLPCVLYYKGELPNFGKEICVSIVGTRNATRYGLNVAFDFGLSLTRAGALVISGGAIGVDSSAHKGALQAGGKTVAVLGCGINARYLTALSSLRETISRNGALLSEYPPDTPALPRYFPERNRIISGLSLGTLVVEAGEKSGSLITARLALDQGRDVFAVPGSIQSALSDGTNRLIKSGCAKPVTCTEDILEEYIWLFPGKIKTEDKMPSVPKQNDNLISETYNETEPAVHILPKEDSASSSLSEKASPSKEKLASLSEEGRTVYGFLTKEAQHTDLLAKKAQLPINKVLCAVTELELSGLLTVRPGRLYSLPE